MSWLDKKITLTFGKEKPKQETKVKKKKNKLSIPVNFVEWPLIAYFTILMFFPEVVAPASGFLTPFMGVVRVLYTILMSILTFALIFGVVILVLKTYTNKLDKEEKEPDCPNVIGWPSFIFSTLKSVYFIWISFSLGHGYLAVLLSISLLFGIFYKYIERDFVAKMLKLKLAWEEPKKNDPFNLVK